MQTLVLDPRYKESQTDTHVFFLTGPLSNWHPSRFVAPLPSFVTLYPGRTYRFCSNEQYMMASKAALFGDEATLHSIMTLMPEGMDIGDALVFEELCIGSAAQTYAWNTICRQHKAFGRVVQGFQPDVWDTYARPIVAQGAQAKFAQNPHLAAYLAARHGKTLVEGAHYDRVWGVALAWDDPRIMDQANWNGTNWLGETLTALSNSMHNPAT